MGELQNFENSTLRPIKLLSFEAEAEKNQVPNSGKEATVLNLVSMPSVE